MLLGDWWGLFLFWRHYGIRPSCLNRVEELERIVVSIFSKSSGRKPVQLFHMSLSVFSITILFPSITLIVFTLSSFGYFYYFSYFFR